MKKKRTWIIIFVTILNTFLITKRIANGISSKVINAAYVQVEKENDLALKKAFNSKDNLKINSDDLFIIYKNKNDDIIDVTFNIENSEKLMNYITKEMTKSIDKTIQDGYVMFIPTGTVFSTPLLSNLGPKIPVKIALTNIAMGNIRTELREYGINNVLVELYVDIDVKTAPILLSQAKVINKKYSFLLSSKLIAGKVPEVYGGKISKESAIFNLPVRNNL